MPDLQKIRKREGEYWKTRFQTVEEALHKTIDECFENIENQITRATRRIDNELFKFFVKFADVDNVGFAEAKRLLTDTELTDFKMSLEEYIDKATRNANADYYDKNVAKELEKASLRYRVTRLEAMQYQLKAYMAELFGDIDYETDKLLAELYQEQYARTAFEIFKGTGVLNIDFTIPDWDAINILIHKPWRVDGSNFSERYGAYRDQLVQDLNDEIVRVIYNGEGYQGASRALAKKMGTNAISGGALYNAKRLIYTESAYFCGLSQDQCFRDLGVEKYQFRSELNSDVCENCQEMDGEIFPLNERHVGVNAPPMHPFCVLPDTIIASPDGEALTKSEYSGEIVEITTANGGKLSVTPNHIMLTSRGWVRAKSLVEGDQIIYYSGWDKLCVEVEPTDNNGVPTVEELFTSLLESGFCSSVRMPITPEDFKGDGVENGEVDIIFIDSFLRSKLDSTISKFLSDTPLVRTTETGEVTFDSKCSLAKFLMGAAAASDGLMSGPGIAEVLLRGTTAHHESIGLGVRAGYNARLYESAVDNVPRDMEPFSDSIDTLPRIVKRDNFIDREFMSVNSTNSVIIKDLTDGSRTTMVDLTNFFDRFAGAVKFDDILRINVKTFSGHVYDVSSLSTLYICNGFLSSNCRCVTVPYVDNSNIPGYIPEQRSGRNEFGKSVLFPADMTYKQWYKQYGQQLEENENS